jgi:hypothetical protein
MDDWHDWDYSGDGVSIPNWPDGPALPQREILSRVAAAFRRVVIDWTEGDQWTDYRISKLVEIGSHSVVVENERALRGKWALVSVADAAGPDAAWVRFFTTPHDEGFELHYEPSGAEAACRALARKLAEVLGYEFATEEELAAKEEAERPPPSDSLMHRDLFPIPDAEGRVPTPIGCLSTEELLQRVARRFPLAVIDRERADQWIRAGADSRAAQVGSPTDPSVERHLAMVGRVAHVTIRDAVGGPQFSFFLLPQPTVIKIDYERPEDREACRPLLAALVQELPDFHHMTENEDIESEDLDD